MEILVFNGIDEKDMDALLKKYPPPTGLEAPKLNPEFATTLAEASVKEIITLLKHKN